MSVNKLLIPKWKKRTDETHQEHQKNYNGKQFDVVFIGDSMMERWGTTVKEYLTKMEEKSSIALMGVGGDGIENLLYRLQDERCILDHVTVNKCIFLMIGTNNLEKSSIEHMVDGIKNIITIIKSKVNENVTIKFLLLPHRSDVDNEKTGNVNLGIKKMIVSEVSQVECHSFFDEFTFGVDYDDHVHFNKIGYQKWYSFIQ